MYCRCMCVCVCLCVVVFFFFFNDTATTEIYTLSLQRRSSDLGSVVGFVAGVVLVGLVVDVDLDVVVGAFVQFWPDRKSTRLNSSH